MAERYTINKKGDSISGRVTQITPKKPEKEIKKDSKEEDKKDSPSDKK